MEVEAVVDRWEAWNIWCSWHVTCLLLNFLKFKDISKNTYRFVCCLHGPDVSYKITKDPESVPWTNVSPKFAFLFLQFYMNDKLDLPNGNHSSKPIARSVKQMRKKSVVKSVITSTTSMGWLVFFCSLLLQLSESCVGFKVSCKPLDKSQRGLQKPG